MKTNRRQSSPRGEHRAVPETYDEADWVDWDHWRTVEEIQDFLNGLGEQIDTEGPGETADGNAQVARQIRRYGLEVDG